MKASNTRSKLRTDVSRKIAAQLAGLRSSWGPQDQSQDLLTSIFLASEPA